MTDIPVSTVGDARVRHVKGAKRPEAERHHDPVFRIVSQRDPDENGRRGVFCTIGTRVFAFGQEITNVMAIKVETDYGGPDSVPITTVTLAISGSQVRTEFEDELKAATAAHSQPQ